jgi:hypothetical protein
MFRVDIYFLPWLYNMFLDVTHGKKTILDLENSMLPADATVSSEKAMEVYKILHEFKDVCFKQFKECFANHHKAGCLLA